jgi:hypothetical protein
MFQPARHDGFQGRSPLVEDLASTHVEAKLLGFREAFEAKTFSYFPAQNSNGL